MNPEPTRNAASERWLAPLLALILAGVFLYAGALKIRDPVGFVGDLRNYRLFPWWSLHLIALLAPWWEVLAGAALLVPSWRRSGAALALGMGVIFLGSVGQALARGLDISCGCFGHGDKAAHAGLSTLAIDAGIIIAAAYIVTRAPAAARTPATVHPTPRATAAPPVIAAAAPLSAGSAD